MTPVELKTQLHELIEQETSLEKLEAVQNLLTDTFSELTDAQKKELDRRLQRLESGESKLLSWGEVKANIRSRRNGA